MARTTHQAAPVETKRLADKPAFHGDSWLNRAAWPVAFLAAVYLVLASAVFFRYGEEQAKAWLDFLAGPAFLAALTILVTAGITVVRKVQQMAKGEMWSATAASTAASTRTEVAELKEIVKAQPAAAAVAREPDPDTGEIKALVLQLARDVQAIQANAASAAQAATSARDTVVGYGQSLQSIATSTGELRSRAAGARDAALDALAPMPDQQPRATPEPARPLQKRPATRWEPRAEQQYEPRQQPPRSPDPLDTRYPHHRDATAEQPAVPPPPSPAPVAGDEEEDWQDTSEGPGLDTSLVRGFRADAARLAAEEEARRRARAQPTTVPAWEPEPIRAARARAEEHERQQRAREQLRERATRWDNPEEGPR